MRRLFTFTFIGSLFLVSLYCSCKKKDKEVTPDDDFDRAAMLSNTGNNVIIPAYQNFNTMCLQLDQAVAAFNTAPDNASLTSLQSAFKNAYIAWQTTSSFGFGPADRAFLSKNINTFPTDSVLINSNINSGSYNLDALSNISAKGFPGIDYLLFGTGPNNAAILSLYTTDAKAGNRKKYLAALSASIKMTAAGVLNEWLSSGGNYINTFMNATGTDIGSSLGQFVNQLNFDLEILKNYKLGTPLGKQSMGTLFPTKTEAYYSKISVQLALIQLKSLQNIYQGKNAKGDDGLGLDDYLIKLNAPYNGGSLNDAINSQFAVAISKLQAVPDPLSDNVSGKPANDAYVEIQKLVALLKTDLSSALGVLITYEDNDGD